MTIESMVGLDVDSKSKWDSSLFDDRSLNLWPSLSFAAVIFQWLSSPVNDEYDFIDAPLVT